jgi:hypothetical protein
MTRGTEWLTAAEDSWRHGDALEAGKLLYEHLVVNQRPGWALAVLDACCAGLSVPSEVEAVREIACTRARWAEAHAAFQAVRKLVLRGEQRRTDARGPEHGVLYLAENVAKVTYNASFAAPRLPMFEPAIDVGAFDHDAGWWVAKNARWIVEHSTDSGLEARVWAALARH